MAKRGKTPEEFDSPWKEALHDYFPFFLAFFFPDTFADIDWQHGYEALDKEFQRIVRRAGVGKRFADKLFKVWLKDGGECWLLIHVEVQGDYEKNFGGRMFDYNAAARRLYNREVVSLAVLCDEHPDWRPTTFAYGRWGCQMQLTFRIAKLLDYTSKVTALENDANPFATVVLAHLRALETKRDPAKRHTWKIRLVKGLYQGHWQKEDVRRLFRLIDWIMILPEELEEAFRTEVFEFEKEKRMEYITSVERSGIKKGLLEGVAPDLEIKFGAPGKRLLRKVAKLNLDELREFARFVKTAESLDDVRARLK